MPPKVEDDLDKLKTARSNKKRAVTVSYNILERKDILGTGNIDQDTYDRLKTEFSIFTASHDDYMSAIEKTDNHEDNADWKTSAAYLSEVEAKLDDVKLKVEIVKARLKFEEDFDDYRTKRSQVENVTSQFNEDSEDDLRRNGKACIFLENLERLHPEFQKRHDILRKSHIAIKRACEKGKRDLRLEEEAIGYNVDDDLGKFEKAIMFLQGIVRSETLQKEKEEAEMTRVQAQQERESRERRDTAGNKPAPIKLEKVENLKFDGHYRSWAAFIKEFKLLVHPNRDAADIGMRLKQAMPARFSHLIANMPAHDYEKMEEVLEKKFGNKRHIIDACIKEIENMKKPNTDEAYIQMYEKLEKIQLDCEAVNLESSLDHTQVIKKVEERLPDLIYDKWLDFALKERLLESYSGALFPRLLEFMHSMYVKADYVAGDPSETSGKSKYCSVTAATSEPASSHKAEVEGKKKQESQGSSVSSFKLGPCLACYKDGADITEEMQHRTGGCNNWKRLSLVDKKKLVNCLKHPFAKDGHKTVDCQEEFRGCRNCDSKNHHTLLCDRADSKVISAKAAAASPDIPAKTSCAKALIKTLFVRGRSDDELLGLMEDGGSTDNFIRIEKAKEMKLRGEPVVLNLEGINDTKRVDTYTYEVPIQDRFGRTHCIECYGLEEIASEAEVPEPGDYRRLCDKFKIDPEQVKRPRQIDILLSARDNFLMSDEVVDSMDGVKLYSGPLGLTFMGDIEGGSLRTRSYPIAATQVSVKRARVVRYPLSNSEFITFFHEDSAGVDCKCPAGNKQKTIKQEREYGQFKKNMYLDEEGTEEDPGPYWRTSYPWVVPREDLPNNRPAVLGVMNTTARKLDKDPTWRQTYEQQLRDLIDKGFAKEVSEQELDDWTRGGGKTHYIAHQMVIDESNKTSPIRCVFNSSQRYKGHSLNSSWALGPDMTGELNSILLRFREGLVAAQGDVRKMYYAIRVEEVERMMQLWVWKFANEDKVRVFSMTRLVMGNKPSANVSQIALKETAHLNDNDMKFPDAKAALCDNAYVDNVFCNAQDHQEIRRKIEETEKVAAQGGFSFKPWLVSGQNIEEVPVVPEARLAADDTEKALGLFWLVKLDKLMVKVQINGKKRKIVLSLNNLIDNPSLKLTVRDCLSLHARCFDPMGLVLPVKMTGAILFRNTLQVISIKIKSDGGGKRLPWDEEVEGELRIKWMEYFRMLEAVSDITFPRSTQPAKADPNIKPVIVTLSDGGRDAYGAVAYYLWTLKDGSKEARLVSSKAKLGPLLENGEPVKNELSGAVFSVRIKSWIIENSSMTFGEFYPFVDSQIVWWMMRKESYELSTFYGNRVKELGQKSDVTSWNHIAREYNGVADILTRGATPDMIREDSEWQLGPRWLTQEQDSWPVTQVDLNKEQRELVKSLERVSKVMKATTHSESQFDIEEENWIDVIVRKVSDLNKLVNIVAHFLRLEGRAQASQVYDLDSEAVKFKAISAAEHDDALKILIENEQKRFKVEKLSGFDISSRKFTLNSGRVIELKILQSRVKNFPIQFGNLEDFVFLLPAKNLAKRIASYHHNKFHRDIDTVVTQIRKEFWISGLRKIVSVLDRNCRQCLTSRQKLASQLMGDLPDFRSQPSSPFSSSTLDLFGPILIRDSVVRRGPRVKKKVWGFLATCAATRAVYLDIAEDYSTDSVLHCIRRLQAEKGKIDLLVSDPGTQLKGADNELKEVRQGWSEEELVRFGAKHGIQWKFTMAASAHQNGVTESLVKMVKGVMRSLMEAIGNTVLNLNELFTLCKEVQSLCNERPIGLKPNNQTDPAFLSPNSLLLGRCADRVNSGPFQKKTDQVKDPNPDRTRYLLVQSITEQFWRVWTKVYFPTLLRRSKWHHEKRNLQVGDVCLLRDSNAVRGEWRLCRVNEVMPGNDGNVRNVKVMVPPPSLRLMKGAEYPTNLAMNILSRHVNNLIVIAPIEERDAQARPELFTSASLEEKEVSEQM